jgi:hypothetical protein
LIAEATQNLADTGCPQQRCRLDLRRLAPRLVHKPGRGDR